MFTLLINLLLRTAEYYYQSTNVHLSFAFTQALSEIERSPATIRYVNELRSLYGGHSSHSQVPHQSNLQRRAVRNQLHAVPNSGE